MKQAKHLLFVFLLLATVCTQAQNNVGIGTTQPAAPLHIASTDLGDTARGSIIMSRYWLNATDTRASAIYHLASTANSKDKLVVGVSGEGGSYSSPLLLNNAKMVIQADGNVGIGTTTPVNKLSVAGNANFTGNVGIGTTTPVGILHTTSTGLAVLIDGYGLSGSAFTSTLALRSARGTSLAPVAVLTGDRIGSILYSGQNSNTAGNFNNGAGIDVYADENFSATTGGSSMRFATAPLGSVLRLDRVFITNAGNMGIGTSPVASAQLDLSSTTKGFLPPRMTNVQRDAIPGAVAGLIVWCSNCGATGQLSVYNGTVWTNIIGFVPPTVITTAISGITATSAVSGGNVTADGGSAVTARGVCWDIATNPTVALSTKTNDGTGSGIFVSNITGLTPGTTYYVRAYATNAVGTSYGTEFSFTTASLAPPTVITTAISGITSTSAVSGGNVTSDGYSAVTARGVCWDIAPNPTIALPTKTNNGSGTGSFVSNITGLTLGTTYYVRAYATNAIGTSYGAEFSFTALGIGGSYQGGVIAYILEPSDPGYDASQTHGLIAAASDQSTSAQWGCNGNFLGALGVAIGTGNQNTITIMAGCATAGIAARICGDLVLNGYSDWYLPSKDELNKLYINRVAVGGFSSNNYWSSSEYFDNLAWFQFFNNGSQSLDFKNITYYVRAVRAF